MTPDRSKARRSLRRSITRVTFFPASFRIGRLLALTMRMLRFVAPVRGLWYECRAHTPERRFP